MPRKISQIDKHRTHISQELEFKYYYQCENFMICPNSDKPTTIVLISIDT